MLFNSLEFIAFFLVVTAIYFVLPHRFRWFHLLAASCLFYMAFIPIYILVLFCLIIIDYAAGIFIEKADSGKKKWYLAGSIAANMGILAFFKYYNFFAVNVNHLFHLSNAGTGLSLLNVVLPIGLSFHTFQALSYTIEVYRGNQKAERHLGIYALYVMFYPQLMAGPIERPQNMLPQFHERKEFSYDDAGNGIKLVLWGLFKKAVIADRLAFIVDRVYDHPSHYGGLAFVIATVFFAFEIYCDFSAYSDIAVGTAQVMGFRLMANFNRPYSARSLSEFWRRWHISLSSWFNDYVFTPLSLQWRNAGMAGLYAAIMVTFIVIGLWHGAGWNYIAMGALFGIGIVYETATRKLRKHLWQRVPGGLGNAISVLLTFSFVCFAYIFFRAHSLRESLYILRLLPSAVGDIKYVATHHHLPFGGISFRMMLNSCLLILLMLWAERKGVLNIINRPPRAVRWGIYYAVILCIIFLGVYQQKQFIYFQF
jgi:alginate O-acetyltransferase complex protein AlgI